MGRRRKVRPRHTYVDGYRREVGGGPLGMEAWRLRYGENERHPNSHLLWGRWHLTVERLLGMIGGTAEAVAAEDELDTGGDSSGDGGKKDETAEPVMGAVIEAILWSCSAATRTRRVRPPTMVGVDSDGGVVLDWLDGENRIRGCFRGSGRGVEFRVRSPDGEVRQETESTTRRLEARR